MARNSRPIRVRVHKSKSVTTESFRRLFSVASGVFVSAGLVLSLLIWLPSMEAEVGRRATLGPTKVRFDWPAAAGGEGATWVPGPVRDELLSRAITEVERCDNPFSHASLEAASASLMRTGWFESPPSVVRDGDVYRIEATWRTPAAVVRQDGVDYLISREGHLLPLAYQRGQAPVIAITGAAHQPPRVGGQLAPGQVWPGEDIRAALETLAFISGRPWKEQVAAIDVAEYPSARRIALISKWEGRTVIGGAPRDIIPGEVTFDVKLRRLDELVRQFGQVDARHRLVEVAGPVILVDDVRTAHRDP